MATPDEIRAEAARPMSFFPHDSNASSDIKCRRLVRRLGMEGYGRWWRLCELLAASDGHVLRLDTEEDAELAAEELLFDTADGLMEYLATLKDIGLVKMPGDGTVSSDRMARNAEYFGKRRASARAGGKAKKKHCLSNA